MNAKHLEEIRAEETRRKTVADIQASNEDVYKRRTQEYTERFITQCVERIESHIKTDLANGIKHSDLDIDGHCGVNYIPDFKYGYVWGYKERTCDVYDDIHNRVQANIMKWDVPVNIKTYKNSERPNYYLYSNTTRCINSDFKWEFKLE